ncbi:peptidoglycan DD-metalloendopeptidase family protein [Nocardioides sp. C4-1]|uniref:peptidoglycan DD-metalloendopeptidase family protein n=1 Tax=Nocardioides sp. C4-1 TaxID=3151851 RepID=UPI0032672680
MCDGCGQSGTTTSAIDRRGVFRLGAGLGGLWLASRALTATPAHAADLYNPFTGYAITGTWQEHLDRGSLGGIDYGMGVGTALPASGAGTITNTPDNGTGGHTVTISHGDGWRTQYLHLSSFSCSNGQSVARGQTVGLSGGAAGAPGSGSSTGPHCHVHLIDPSGVRRNPLEVIGGGAGLPKTSTAQDGVPGTVFWKRVQNAMRIEAGYTGPIDGVPGVNTYAALQRHLRDHFGYAGPIDGKPGTNTWAALQRLAARHGYTGPVDGVMGANSWRGVAGWVNADAYD